MVAAALLFCPRARRELPRYLWDESAILTRKRMPELLPGFKGTPLEGAVRATVRSDPEPAPTPA